MLRTIFLSGLLAVASAVCYMPTQPQFKLFLVEMAQPEDHVWAEPLWPCVPLAASDGSGRLLRGLAADGLL